MKGIILSTLVSFGLLMGSSLYADDCKKQDSAVEKPSSLSSQVIDSKDKDVKAEAEKKNEEAPKPLFHFPGHSEWR